MLTKITPITKELVYKTGKTALYETTNIDNLKYINFFEFNCFFALLHDFKISKNKLLFKLATLFYSFKRVELI